MLNILISSLLSVFNMQSEPPFKPSGDFELKIEYIFKERPPTDRQVVLLDDESNNKASKSGAGQLPYLQIQLKVLSVTDQEKRIRILDTEGRIVYNRKGAAGSVIKLDWGFTEDIKYRLISHEYAVQFLDEEKKTVSRIYMFIEEDGTFLVNGETRGKF
jgi:hypothetical protein